MAVSAAWKASVGRGSATAAALRAPAPRMDVKFPILGFLMESEMTSMSGYDLKRMFQDSVGVFYRASDGSLYPALAKLERQKLVKMRLERHGRRTRKIYSVTAAGRSQFLKMLGEPSAPTFVHDEALIKLFFARHRPAAGVEHLMRMVAQDEDRAERLSRMTAEAAQTEKDPFRRLVVEAGARIMASKADLMAELAARLRRELKQNGARNGRAGGARK